VLFGAVDPSGRLPLTFPASDGSTPVASTRQFPGTDAVVHYSEDLDIGYRWYETHKVRPLFAFGFGLAYTSFALSHASLQTRRDDVVVTVKVADTGRRPGTDAVQVYLGYPPSAGEPPHQLRAFDSVALKAHSSRTIRLDIARSAFEAYLGGRMRTVAGRYSVDVGQSSSDLPIHLSAFAP
jgi:beta-glucosidase